MNENKWNSRKLAVTLGVVASATGLMYFGQITADQFIDLVKWVVGPYLVAQSFVDRADS